MKYLTLLSLILLTSCSGPEFSVCSDSLKELREIRFALLDPSLKGKCLKNANSDLIYKVSHVDRLNGYALSRIYSGKLLNRDERVLIEDESDWITSLVDFVDINCPK